ncbi:uncharacterized protein EI90DRAFT_3034002 [Cantharellus anzutake]|uniref:uncharacterized protein n=1 Tax=Cantharellus anzutake TaxID=1750568 RepID=UPI0019039747|nr:uncharacterized protein EI90DRAFT_3034002 [Cantharellus anzutake]KAF8341450.1 hypothetical protein EI90DRAFT_3034002 [Cantharellus anzutake]
MSFAHAPVTKGMMLGFGIGSLLASLFDIKYYFHLQLVPHISRDHQYWRLLVSPFVLGNSSDLVVVELVLYQVSIQIERAFGSLKFFSFAAVSTAISTLLSFISLLAFHRLGLNYMPSGPLSLIFSILYQYHRVIPDAYEFRIGMIDFSNKIFVYILAFHLVLTAPPGSVVAALMGVFVGALYRSDMINLKTVRPSPSLQRFASRYILPLIGSTNPPRRDNRALPDDAPSPQTVATTRSTSRPRPGVRTSGPSASISQQSPTVVHPRLSLSNATAAAPSVLNQWVDELTGRGRASGVRVPTSDEITQLSSMFPEASRDVVLRTLQRSSNIEDAVEIMLSEQ